MVVTLDGFIVFVATPSIGADLGASDAELQWVIAAYVLTFALGLITGGRLGDSYGRRRIFSAGLLLFGLSSGLCGAAPTATVLIAARALQGIGAALMAPQVLSIIQVEFPAGERGRAMAILGLVQGAAAVGGQLLGGLLIELNLFGLEWRTIFLVNVPLCAIGAVLSRALVPESRSEHARRLDLGGVGLATLAVGALMIPLVEGRSLGWPLWAFASLGAVAPLVLAFLAWERRVLGRDGSPLVALELFRFDSFRLGIPLSLVFYTSVPGVILTLMIYMQDGLGFSPILAGLAYAPAAAGFSIAALTVGRLPLAKRERALVPGIAITAAGVLASALVALLVDAPGAAALAPAFLLIGVGHGTVIPALNGTVMVEASSSQAGSAAGLLTTSQQLGGALGVAIGGTVFFAKLGAAVGPGSYGEALAAAAVFVLPMLALAGALGWHLLRRVEDLQRSRTEVA